MAAEHGHDIDGQDLDQRFARFGLRPLTDAEVWALSMATMVLPDGSPGPEGYLSKVSGTALFAKRLTDWGLSVASGISRAGYMGRNGRRRRAYVESYCESWGRYAVADGLTLALYGHASDAIGKGKDQGYRRIRDFVGGAMLSAITDFVVALEWSIGRRRDRMLEGRWEALTGLNFGEARVRATMGREGDKNPLPPDLFVFAAGCSITEACPDLDGLDAMGLRLVGKSPPRLPETMYPGINPSQCWDERSAAPGPVISYAPPRKIPPRC